MCVTILLLFVVALSTPAAGQQPSEEELTKQTQNPVADLISVPLQSNFNFGAGFHHSKMMYILNIQPVIPLNLSDEWNLIARIIMPINNQPNLSPSFGKLFRLGQLVPLEAHPIAKLPINIQLAAYGNVARPEFGPKWQLRFQIQFLFPK